MWVSLAFVLLAAIPPHALSVRIIRRHDKSDSLFRVANSKYPSVFPYSPYEEGELDCAATLIDSTHALTAAHCFDEGNDPFWVRIAGTRHRVKKVLVHPCYDFRGDGGPEGADFAIMVLQTPSKQKPYQRYSAGDEVGKLFTLIGWGFHGKAGGRAPSNNQDGNLREGQNVFTDIQDNKLVYVMDKPGSSKAVEKEAIAWSGDSGGPAFIESNGVTYLAGINSAGECCKYGSEDEYARVGSKLSRDWIDASIAAGEAQKVRQCELWGRRSTWFWR